MPSIRVGYFDTWRPGYASASVAIRTVGGAFADVFLDENLTAAAANPQTLLSQTDEGVTYGRWAAPLYVGVPYYLEINSVDRTGIIRPPIVTLAGADASEATAVAEGGSEAFTLEDHFARRIDVRDFGEFLAVGEDDASTATNTSALVAAIAAAAAAGGGFVEVPAGTFQVSAFTIPQGVVVVGRGREVTTIRSLQSGNVATIGGARAGLSCLTLDGVTLVASSVGIYAANKDQIVLDDVEVKRFATGIDRRGGSLSRWKDLFVSNCSNGVKLYGDAASGAGAALLFNSWRGGKVELCPLIGVDLRYVDRETAEQTFADVFFEGNSDQAVRITGARQTNFENCRWRTNTNCLTVTDGTADGDDDTIIGLNISGGSMTGGTMLLSGNLERVAFRRVELSSLTVTLSTPGHNILIEDCRENEVEIEGIPTAWTRHNTGDRGATFGLTTGNSATKAWGIELEAGQKVYLEAKVIGRQRNGTNHAFYHIAVSAQRPGAELDYDSQTANFTVGDIVTGEDSGATARITADADAGATGTLTLQDISGVFEDNEIITDSLGGSATANGTQTYSDAALVGSVASLRAAEEADADWACTFVANGPEIELRVTGDTSQTVEWTVDVEVVSI